MRYSIPIIVVIFIVGCSAGRGIEPEKKTKPVEIIINAPYEKVYKSTAEILSDYNFPIGHTDNLLGIIKTDFIKYKAGSKGFWYKALAGIKDFEIQISAKISRLGASASKLQLAGKMKYKEEKSIFKTETKIEPIKTGTDSYKQIEKIGQKIKERAE